MSDQTIYEKARLAAAKGGELTRNERYCVDWAVAEVLAQVEAEARRLGEEALQNDMEATLEGGNRDGGRIMFMRGEQSLAKQIVFWCQQQQKGQAS